MLDLSLSDEQIAVRDAARTLGQDILDASARTAEGDRGLGDKAWRRLLDTGLVAPVAAEYGGGGIPDVTTSLLVVEELARGDAALAAAATWSGHAAILVGLCGTEANRQALLPRLAADPAARGAVAMYEGYGRSPSEYRTTITPEGGRWRVAGRKVGVAAGESAEPLIVVGNDPVAGRMRAAVVPRTNATGEIIVHSSNHLGLDPTGMATISFDTVVDTARLVGGEDGSAGGLAQVMSRLRLTTAALAVGCAQRAREYASKYLTGRVAFGRPLAGFQGVAFLMADAQMQLDSARLQIWNVASRLDVGGLPTHERDVSMTVNYSTSIAAHVTRDSVQVLGGHGFIADHPVERWYRTAAGLASLDCDPTCAGFAPAL